MNYSETITIPVSIDDSKLKKQLGKISTMLKGIASCIDNYIDDEATNENDSIMINNNIVIDANKIKELSKKYVEDAIKKVNLDSRKL